MRNGRFAGALLVGLAIAALALAGCGTASSAAPSGLDPANMAPAGAVMYMSVTVRPQGNLATEMSQALAKLAGPNVTRSIISGLNRSLRKDGLSYGASIKPWLGQRVGLVFTQFPQAGLASASIPPGMALIMPTKNPSAARAFIHSQMKRTPGTYGRVSGDYAVIGGALAYQQTLGLTPSDSLAASPGYRSTMSELGSGTDAMAYMNLRRFRSFIASNPQAAGLSGQLLRSISRIGPNGAAAVGLTLTPSAIRFDTVETGVTHSAHRSTADVGGLPAGSWLALATGGLGAASEREFRAGFQIGLMNSLNSQGLSGGALAGAMTQRLAFIERDVLPVLGPMSLAVGGTGPLNLTAGLKLTPASLAAATRLLGNLRALAARNPALSVTGRAGHFSVRVPTGSNLLVSEISRAIVATYGFAGPRAFLSPSAKLANDPAYRQAYSQLPSGSRVPFYLSFGPVTTLVQLTDHQPSAAKTVRVLEKLSYVIIGGVPGHTRMVLGLK